MADAKNDAKNNESNLEQREEKMIAEGGPVQPSTDPERDGATERDEEEASN